MILFRDNIAVVNPNAEINRLRELMPASARMNTKLTLNDRQMDVIKAEFPVPWRQAHTISMNLNLWQQLSVPERDLLFLRTACWVTQASLLKPSWYQAMAGGPVWSAGPSSLFQGDAIGVAGGGRSYGLAAWQLWRGVKWSWHRNCR